MPILSFFSFLFFETKTHLFGAGSSPRLSLWLVYVQCHGTYLLFCHCHLFMFILCFYPLHTSITCHLPFVAFELIPLWFGYYVSCSGRGRRAFLSILFFFSFFGHCNYQQILDICTDLLVFICLNIMYKFAHEPIMKLSVSPISYIPYSPFYSCPR